MGCLDTTRLRGLRELVVCVTACDPIGVDVPLPYGLGNQNPARGSAARAKAPWFLDGTSRRTLCRQNWKGD